MARKNDYSMTEFEVILLNYVVYKENKKVIVYLLIDLEVNRVPSKLVVAVWLNFGLLLANNTIP